MLVCKGIWDELRGPASPKCDAGYGRSGGIFRQEMHALDDCIRRDHQFAAGRRRENRGIVQQPQRAVTSQRR